MKKARKKEKIDTYNWFIDLYGRKRLALELVQEWKNGYQEGLEEIRQEHGNYAKAEVTLDVLKNSCCLEKIAKMTYLHTKTILKFVQESNLLDA